MKLCALGGAAGFAAAYPVFIERNIVLVNRYTIPVPDLPVEFAGFTIVHLTDFHYGLLVSLRFVEDVVARANRIPADVIVCTGDYVHERNSTAQIDTVWPVIARLRAPLGVYSVLGNHDHWAGTARSRYWLQKAGQNLHGKVKALERNGKRLWLAGGGDLWEDHIGFDGLLAGTDDRECRIVLAHNPDSADTGYSARIDLMISGHTHGGQVNVPFVGAPMLPVKNKSFSNGLVKARNGTRVFISRGIGWAILPVRINCYPEIAVLELVGDRGAGKES